MFWDFRQQWQYLECHCGLVESRDPGHREQQYEKRREQVWVWRQERRLRGGWEDGQVPGLSILSIMDAYMSPKWNTSTWRRLPLSWDPVLPTISGRSFESFWRELRGMERPQLETARFQHQAPLHCFWFLCFWVPQEIAHSSNKSAICQGEDGGTMPPCSQHSGFQAIQRLLLFSYP